MTSLISRASIWALVLLLVVIVAAISVLCALGKLTGADVLIVATPIIAALTGASSAHIAGSAVLSAVNSSPAPVPVESAPAGTGQGTAPAVPATPIPPAPATV